MPEAAKATLRLLKQAGGNVWQIERRGRKVLAYRNPHLVDYLSVGRV